MWSLDKKFRKINVFLSCGLLLYCAIIMEILSSLTKNIRNEITNILDIIYISLSRNDFLVDTNVGMAWARKFYNYNKESIFFLIHIYLRFEIFVYNERCLVRCKRHTYPAVSLHILHRMLQKLDPFKLRVGAWSNAGAQATALFFHFSSASYNKKLNGGNEV